MRKIKFVEALNEAIREEMDRDPKVFVYGLDVTDHKRIFGSTKNLLELYGGGRVFGTPLSEDAMTGFGLGAAISGMRPIQIHIRVDFLLLGFSQLANMISAFSYLTDGQLKVPMVIRAVIGRGWGQGAQHSKSMQSIFSHIPGLKVVMPTTPADAKGLLKTAIRDNNPVIFIEHRWLYDIDGPVPENKDFTIPIGEPNILKRGKDLTVVSTSWMNIEALKAAEILKRDHGIELEVIDPRSLYPLNYNKIYSSVRKTGHCIIADYDWLYCGFSSEVSARINENCFGMLKKPISRIGFLHSPCPTTRPLENRFYPNAVSIIREVEKLLRLKAADLSGDEFYSYGKKFKGPF